MIVHLIVVNFVPYPASVVCQPGEPCWGQSRSVWGCKRGHPSLYPGVVLPAHQGASSVTL